MDLNAEGGPPKAEIGEVEVEVDIGSVEVGTVSVHDDVAVQTASSPLQTVGPCHCRWAKA
jgi:hypothetical protein